MITPPPGQERDLVVLRTISKIMTEREDTNRIYGYHLREHLPFELDEQQVHASLYALLVTGHIDAEYQRSMSKTRHIQTFYVLGLTAKGYRAVGLWDDTALTASGPRSEKEALRSYYNTLLKLEPTDRMKEQITRRMTELGLTD